VIHPGDRTPPPTPAQLADALRVLNHHGVDFVLIGGVAATLHGSSIPTFDLDIAYARDPANIGRLVKALKELNAELRVGGEPPDEPLVFILDEKSIEMGANFTFVTTSGAVDVLGDPGGISSYSDLRNGATEETLLGEPIKLVSLDHLIAMKRHANRAKDKLALEELKVIADEGRSRS